MSEKVYCKDCGFFKRGHLGDNYATNDRCVYVESTYIKEKSPFNGKYYWRDEEKEKEYERLMTLGWDKYSFESNKDGECKYYNKSKIDKPEDIRGWFRD